MGSQQPLLAALYLLGVLGEYLAGASARVPGLPGAREKRQVFPWSGSGPTCHVSGASWRAGPLGSLSVLAAPAQLSGPLGPRPAPHARFPLALWGPGWTIPGAMPAVRLSA